MTPAMRLLTLLGVLALLPAAHAQTTSGGANLVVAVPQGSFADRLDAVGFGLSAAFVHHIAGSHVGIGLEGTFVMYGHERIRERFGGGALGRVDVDVVTTNNIALGHLVLRLQPPSGTFRPYGDALVGLAYLFTESRIEDVDRHDDRDIASSTNFDDAAFSYGLGGGVMARVYEGRSSSDGRPFEVFVDARLRYLFGGEAQYLREGDIEADADGDPLFRYTESRTDVLLPQFGLTIRF